MKDLDEILLEELTYDDLDERIKDLAEEIGIENLKKCCKYASGGGLYFPKIGTLIFAVKKRKILEEYDYTNIKEMKQKYDVAESTVYKIVKEGRSLSAGNKR